MSKLAVLSILSLVLVAGCDSGLRFSPTESQKQNAVLTHSLAIKADAQGAEPSSVVTRQLVKGTLADLLYIGQPAQAPDEAQFDAINLAAQADAVKQPDAWTVADYALGISIAIAGLFGGGGALSVITWLNAAKLKLKALKEIVLGVEIFKAKAPEEAVDLFKDSQKNQSPETRQLVAELKTG